MTLNSHLISRLQGSLGLLSMHLNDLADADLFARPVPNANHANWQLGHLAVAETNMLTDSGIPMPALPEGVAAKYSKEAAKSDDAAKFLKKDQLISLLQATRNATIAWAKNASAAELATPTPEKMRSFAATRADLLAALCLHDAMHMGQLQVIRRKLGKPILF
ncbi:MAG TPA: DinB family protein [Phycisphaerae bacterium]|nr:DinB family protein [Phycisphaerae bacterium]